jgi:hypothetical protein
MQWPAIGTVSSYQAIADLRVKYASKSKSPPVGQVGPPRGEHRSRTAQAHVRAAWIGRALNLLKTLMSAVPRHVNVASPAEKSGA